MLHVVLYQPEIPPNTGNIMRLCANTGAHLHLIKPLGFRLEDRKLRRAGLDYREWAKVRIYSNLESFLEQIKPSHLLAFSTRAQRLYTEMNYQENDALLFGPETRGLPQALLDSLPEQHRLRLPLLPDNRSLNLSNAVAVAVYEAWRKLGFSGGK
ncbi:MAG: tRNA (uridine(34)/cytosine(34)/5-carboxymethylaminomethyluridine(34)-2'-O)-methyltransferase TrmL [Gammaproteobacteria bacterium]|nr:tRNA (uridine(34)/cytosine(34)/5-carboxymethylaminomethyluridine(34)-2'-O)-methyltransferase TrmL [Gammaproteobacteria bacterium]MDH3369931.1 tRNA (uridine(34)/cytosine(34)/5-carboxymethylaminomethyluridine(34)-2'-O)-methyltransferase TrmL [Gammaproteobacteria bacterium]MDH3562014.1 tRNA (uridine(34)/cytosine(34)/5-carboxymethylaminomethyluridine(34)-2'-O)-methyltransferase TrmL [Gammaproteobacteria bacterium]MDH5486450.1 tRNA (uridine(34)/cytosine(34)/5-carboxymethylaminomethyluridine(34)-2'